jgi:1,6-anhydro-N-acetylmuramate kinase
MTYYIGLMSGTSLDGVDGTLVWFGDSDSNCGFAPTRIDRSMARCGQSFWL